MICICEAVEYRMGIGDSVSSLAKKMLEGSSELGERKPEGKGRPEK